MQHGGTGRDVVSIVQQEDASESEEKGGQNRLLALQKTRGQRKDKTRDYYFDEMTWRIRSEHITGTTTTRVNYASITA